MRETSRSDVDRANCLKINFGSELVEHAEVSEEGGVLILLNEEGQEHLDQINHMREVHK